MRLRVLFSLIVLAFPLAVRAQPLADRVPADAMIYLAWQGSGSLGPAYDKSHLKAVLDSSNLPQVFNDMLPRLIERMNQEDPNVAQVLRLVTGIGGPLWRHPTAFYFAGFDFEAQPNPQLKAALICRAGNEADALLKQFDGIISMLAGIPFAIRSFRQDDLVVLSVGYPTEAAAVVAAGAAAKSLAASDVFKQAVAQVHKEPVAFAYVDIEAALKLIDRGIQLGDDRNAKEYWPKLRAGFGVDGLKRFAVSGAFDGADWSTQAFLAAPAPRGGLLALIDAQPVTDDMLRLIPKTATWMSIARFDLAKFVAELRNAMARIGPEAQQGFDMAMGVAQMALAMNVQKDLFEPLGDQWALYVDPAGAGRGLTGITLVNRLNKPDEAQRALNKLELFIDNAVNGQLAQQRMRVSFEQTKVGDMNIHHVVLPLVSPSWTIKNGSLYAALYPQTLAALQYTPANAGSILDNPDFQALRKRLGAEKASGVSFTDLPRNIDQGYQLLLMGSQLAMGLGDMFGVKSPPMVIPPLGKLREHLSPAGSCTWTDEAGWHSKSVCPFPGSEVLGSQGGLITAALPAAGLLGFTRAQAFHVRAGRAEAVQMAK